MKIRVVGTGYLGLSITILLAQHQEEVALEIDSARVPLINARQPCGLRPLTDF